MKKVIFTKSQFDTIMESTYGLESGGGYLNQNDGSEPDEIAWGDEVFTDPDSKDFEEPSTVATTDRVATELNPRRSNPLHGTKCTTPVYEDIEKQTFIFSKAQKGDALKGGSKMGVNIAKGENGKGVSNGTQRKRKHDLAIKQQQMSPEEFKKVYGKIQNVVKSSLKQMSNMNKTLSDMNDVTKLATEVDPSKTKTTTGKGHHKDGEQLNNGGILHYFE